MAAAAPLTNKAQLTLIDYVSRLYGRPLYKRTIRSIKVVLPVRCSPWSCEDYEGVFLFALGQLNEGKRPWLLPGGSGLESAGAILFLAWFWSEWCAACRVGTKWETPASFTHGFCAWRCTAALSLRVWEFLATGSIFVYAFLRVLWLVGFSWRLFDHIHSLCMFQIGIKCCQYISSVHFRSFKLELNVSVHLVVGCTSVEYLTALLEYIGF